MELKITASNGEDLKNKVISLAKQFGVDLTTVQAEIIVEAEKIETPKEEKVKKGNAKAQTKSAVVEAASIVETAQVVSDTNQTTSEKPATLSKQNIADACQKVSGAKGLAAAKEILGTFKNAEGVACRRISDIQEADYAKFISDCEKALV